MKNPKIIIIIASIGAGLLIIALLLSTVSVPTGHTGIVTNFGQVTGVTLDAGLHLKSPFSRIVKMDNREQKMSFETQAFSSDIQQVDIAGSITYGVDKTTAMTLFKGVGTGYCDTLITPRLLENIKAVFSRYSAGDLVGERGALSSVVRDALRVEMEAYGINIITLSIEDIDFTDAFTNAVESKQVAEQTKLRVETEEAQKVSVEQASAQRRIIAAEADAQERQLLAEADLAVAKKTADAEAYTIEKKAIAEAEANRIVAESLTQTLIDYVRATNWDGKNPMTILGEGIVSVITP